METKELRRPISGRAIRAAREWQEMTQQQLADALTEATGDVWTAAQVLNLESGRKVLDVDTLRALTEVQDMSPEWYMYGLTDRATSATPAYLKWAHLLAADDPDAPFPDELLPGEVAAA